MILREKNYAFIDGQNMHKGTTRQGWRVDYGKLRVYLRNKYQVERAYIFLGYDETKRFLYQKMEKSGFVAIFKETSISSDGGLKGNCDSDMVLRICMDFWNFDKAVMISGDGDFYSTCEVLDSAGKLRIMLAPSDSGFARRYYRLGSDKVALLADAKEQIARVIS